MRIITPLQSAILSHLSTFRFLTPFQLVDLQAAKHPQTVRKALQELQTEKKPLVKRLPFGVLPGIGKLPDVFYLTKYGAQAVAEEQRIDPSEIPYPKNQTQYGSDYFHRRTTIDFHILLWRFCQMHQVEIDFFAPYYRRTGATHQKDKNASTRQALSRVTLAKEKYFEADAIFSLTDPENKQWIFALEIHKGKDTKRGVRTLLRHAQAIEQGSINAQYQYTQAIPVLMVCETQEAKAALQHRLSSLPQFQNLEKYILLKSEEEICIDSGASNVLITKAFALGWQTFRRNERQLFAR